MREVGRARVCVCERESVCGERERERVRERVSRRNSSSKPSCRTYTEMKGYRERQKEHYRKKKLTRAKVKYV